MLAKKVEASYSIGKVSIECLMIRSFNLKQKSYSREYALKYIYHLQLSPYQQEKEQLIKSSDPLGDMAEQIELFDESFSEIDSEHPDNKIDLEIKSSANELIRGTLTHEESLKNLIGPLLKGWTLERLDKIDLSLLLLGSFEIVYEKTPKGIVIDEVVRLAKKYGTKDSFSFINAVLDKIKA